MKKIVRGVFVLFVALVARAADPILPDPALTPGDVLTNVTVEQLCQRGYANVLNGGARHVTDATKRAVFIEYFGRVPDRPGAYEIDHLVSLELGGSNAQRNLWPESYTGQWNSRVKDRLEDRMAANVRAALQAHGHEAATLLLRQYQRQIATNWIASYTNIFQTLKN